MEYSTRGTHIRADFWGIDPKLLNNLSVLMDWMVQAIQDAGATVLGDCSHKFTPQGVTLLLLLSESHMSIHSYPEAGFAALDCYTCGDHVDPMLAIDHMLVQLQPTYTIIREEERGVRK